MKPTFLFIMLLFWHSMYGQMSFRQEIDTDSSSIEIIRNSVYRVYEETFKLSDSIWYSVSYIDDTTQLNTEGWKLKNGKLLGVWKEYNRQGKRMYTHDHSNNTCKVNRRLYPYHRKLEKMKAIADGLIIDAYGEEFMRKHVVFNFDCSAYHNYKTKFGCCEDSMWTEDYLGNWTEPLTGKPNSFLLRYEVRLHPADKQFTEIGICLDSQGKYMPSGDDMSNNYGFEKLASANKKFIISKIYAFKIAALHGLSEKDSGKIDEFLIWENFRKGAYYNGRFRYYITELVKEEKYKKNEERQGIIYRYMVYVFNPWTAEFVEVKKMKRRQEWGKLSGHSTGLIPDND